MLPIDQAAKFIVVAWVKDWGMRTLLETLDGATGDVTEGRLGEMADALPFMPTHLHWYIANRGRGVSCRQFVADCYPRLADALWAANDNAARLKLAPQIERLKAGNVRASSRFSKSDMAEGATARREMRQAITSYRQSRDSFKTHQRSAWGVCK
jgi:hypothetical protein